MKVIPTYYKGIKFRSRIEARWAVFFDALKVRFEYEKEGYSLEGKPYLPDFYLQDLKCFIEIKGEKPTRQEQELAYLLSKESGVPVHIFSGSVPTPGMETWNDCGFETFTFDSTSKEQKLQGQEYLQSIYAVNRCPRCKKVGFSRKGIVGELPCGCWSSNRSMRQDELVSKAYLKARSARFEFEDRK